MAKALKDQFGPDVAKSLAKDLVGAWKAFPVERFLSVVLKGYEELELMDRVRHIAFGLEKSLPEDFQKAARIVKKALGPPLVETSGNGLGTFRYLPYGFWLGEKGMNHPKEALQLQLELTRRCTSEFSVRPFLSRHYRTTLAFLENQVEHSCPHVRRWVSEGTRPHLPWGKGVKEIVENPEGHLHLLEELKDDEHIYVRKSVGNHLNDLSRHHPDLLLRIAKRWSSDAPEGRTWILKQALRTLVKKGNREALGILGYGKAPKIELLEKATFPKKVKKGGDVNLSWALGSLSKKSQPLMVDLVIAYPRSGGKAFLKTFKCKQFELEGGEVMSMKKKISLKDLSTRLHEPGQHDVHLLINGRRVEMDSFVLLK
jgi:3-methyladenine DNA glycosylase AlkC